jgi:CRISPR-associated exonuclease Cas4
MYTEDELLPISALQHLAFCERQWALIHLEGVWVENRLTAEGRVLHERAHEAETESRGPVRIARGLRLRSLRLGLSGIADVVEFHRVEESPGANQEITAGSGPQQEAEMPEGTGKSACSTVRLPGVHGLWAPFPVEYKRGRPKKGPFDEIQLCAQALCLEEMLGAPIPSAALFYGTPMRRTEVVLSAALRAQTENLAARLHELTRRGVTPPPVYEEKCESCSLMPVCMPKGLSKGRSVEAYLASAGDESEP